MAIHRGATLDAPQQPYLKSKKDAARYLGVSLGSVERLMRDRNDPLPFLKIGNLVRIDPSQLADWAQRQRVQRSGGVA